MLHGEINDLDFADLVRHRQNAQRKLGYTPDYAAAKSWVEDAIEKHPDFTAQDLHELITNNCRRDFQRY